MLRPLLHFTRGLRLTLAAPIMAATVLGCSGPPTTDGGAIAHDAGAPDGASVCAADRHCSDDVFCNGQERCEPGHPQAGADGCRPGVAPCAALSCNEATMGCDCGSMSDVDGDGHAAIACGGDDCDDDDGDRFPGNAEVCDDSHDEDCDPLTLGGLDADVDTFVSAACCNAQTCGDDCDDADVNVNPAARESCDGLDNDCDGNVDTAATSLCPGGVCVAGMCQLDGWVRTFGDAVADSATDVAIDSEGNLYVTGVFDGTADFGAGPVESDDQDPVIVSFDPDGLYRWHRSFGYAEQDRANAIEVDDAGNVYVLVAWHGDAPIDFGDGPVSATGDAYALVVLATADGTYRDARPLPSFGIYDIAGVPDGVIVSVVSGNPVDYGGSEPLPAGSSWLRYQAGSWASAHPISSLDFVASAVTVRDGVVLVGGALTAPADLGGGAPLAVDGTPTMALAKYALSDGHHLWSESYPSSGLTIVQSVAITGSDSFCAGGLFRGELILAAGVQRHSRAADETDGFLVCFSSSGAYAWDRVVPGALQTVNGLASDSIGDLFVVGSFSGPINFGGGVVSTSSTAGFVARYTATGIHRWDRAFLASGSSAATAVAIGPANSTAIVGRFSGTVELAGRSRTSSGSNDGFIVRLAR